MKNNLFDLSGRVALVAGGSSGLGLQFAKAMANAGADVAIVARRTDKLEENAKQISDEYGVEVYPHYIDLRDAASVTACVEDVIKHFGKIDILVNAGGVGGSGDPATLTDEQWYYVVDTDLTGLFRLCMALNGGSATFLAPLVVKLIDMAGITAALYIIGAGVIIIGIVSSIGLRTAPSGYIPEGWKQKAPADDSKLKATQLESLTPAQVIKTRAYWHLFLGYGLFPTLYIICYPRFSVLISDAGYSVTAATLGVSLYSIANVASRFLFGALIDKIGYRKVYTLCGVCCVASAVCLMFANSLFMFYAAYVLLAFGFGPTNSCHPVAVQETFGSKYAGGIFGVCMLGYMLICTIISPRISSALAASTGNYTASMIYAIVACIAAVAVYTTIPMPKRRTLAEVEAEEGAKAEKA